jgi:citrate lyase subunit beta/citryl-CoA lyase
MTRVRSWLFAPGHNERILAKVFGAGADAVLLDLEDAVPEALKDRARVQVSSVLDAHPEAWVRINMPRTPVAEADLAAISGRCAGIRIPKVESALEVRWVAERAPGIPLTCTIESARGVLRAYEIAACECTHDLTIGAADLSFDLATGSGFEELLFARSALVVAARAADKPAPIDGAFTGIEDQVGLRDETLAARRLGYYGKSAIHPRQVQVINDVFTPTNEEIEWAQRVVAAFDLAGGTATKLDNGEFVDAPIAKRARLLLKEGL